jgi:4-hydroxythreonine-4-phosphate dehydrogenase
MKPRIVVTMGDPAGVGAEVAIKALADPDVASLAAWRIVGDEKMLNRARRITVLELVEAVEVVNPGPGFSEEPAFGELSARCGEAAVAYIKSATESCLNGEADAMVTAPVNKEAVTMSGMAFTGHTEYIAELCGVNDTRMLLASERLRVVHVSTHVSLRHACDLEHGRILHTIELGNEAALALGIEKPRIAVCGLNPHAGEHGLFGNEDADRIVPAVAAARENGIDCDGPVPADTVFLKAVRGHYDLVVAMYHDQGHIPMKLLDFEHTVNISLGLPIIRTSVDHGTAFDIAGQNLADPTNMKAAMRLACVMAKKKNAPVVVR